MTDFNENNNQNEQQAPPNNPRGAAAENAANAPHHEGYGAPNRDPYQTTGGSTGAGWQQNNPYQAQYNPKTGWSTGANYQNAYTAPQHKPDEEYKWNFAEYDNAAGQKPPKKKHKGILVFTGIICSLFAVAIIGFAGYGIYNLAQGGMPQASSSQSVPEAPAEAPGLNISDVPKASESIATDGVLTTKQIAAKVRPSVVGVVAYVQNAGGFIYGNGANMLATQEGSGIIMSADGYIITNAHVVEGASGMKIVLSNGEEYDAKLVGSDANTDLAVLKIEASNLTAAEFGDSTQLEIGEDVVAIGNPGGLELASSVTKGIISGVNRPIKSNNVGYTMNCIQTDAAINPGNSGGALVNQYGQVVGINSSKIASTEYEGLGFAIPISEAKPIVDDLIANKRVTGRVKLGVSGQEIDETSARYNNVPPGFMIYNTEPGSDIANKGVLAGDIITKVDNKEVTSLSDLREYLRDFKPGDKVMLTIFRRTSGKRDSTFEVSIALMEDTGANVVQEEQIPQQNQSNGKAFSFFN